MKHPTPDAAAVFKALGDETRLRLVNLFLQTTEDLCVCEMVAALGLPQYQISKHLAILKHAGLLRATRRGTWVYYRLGREESPLLRDVVEVLSRHLGQQAFNDDAAKLAERLAMREQGVCVVGFVSAPAIIQNLQPRRARQNGRSKKARHLRVHAQFQPQPDGRRPAAPPRRRPF